MLYQQALKQLNTIFPKLDIKPPGKKATVRSLVQQKECASLTSADFKLLQSTDSAAKPLAKLARILATWQGVLEHNQKARQQQQNKPVSRKALDHLEFMMADCAQIQSKSQFVGYIQEHGGQVYGSTAITASTKEYKEAYICNEIDFYNTIPRIDQDQYFRELEELTEKLGVFEQFCDSASTSIEDLEQFLQVLSQDQLFKKKDNSLNRVINYNLVRVLDLMTAIQKIQKMVYYYKDNLTFSIARCYYLCFQARDQIAKARKDRKKQAQIKKFICDRQEKVFAKLYARKIGKALIKLQQLQSEFLMSPYEDQNQIIQILRFNEEKYNFLEEKFEVLVKPISEAQFIDLYGDIQYTLTNLKLQNEQALQIRKRLNRLEEEIVASFVNESNTGRRYLSLASVRNSVSTVKFGRDSIEQDMGDDIFIKSIQPQQKEDFRKKVDELCEDKDNFVAHCQNLLGKVSGDMGDQLEDFKNIEIQQALVLLEAGKSMSIQSKEIEEIETLVKNLVRLQLSEQSITKIFQPNLRIQVLRSLGEKLVEHSYKLTKTVNSPEFAGYPENIKKFALARESFVKHCQRELDNIIKIADIISRLKQKSSYDVCDQMTYQTFLKVLLAKKETKAYEMSYRDVKQISKNAKNFLQQKVYTPFLLYLDTILPEKAKSLVEDLDEIEFFVDFVYQTDGILQKYTHTFEQDQESQSELRPELARILTKWASEAENKIKNRKAYYTYEKAEQQLDKVNESILICKGDNPPQLKYAAGKSLAAVLT